MRDCLGFNLVSFRKREKKSSHDKTRNSLIFVIDDGGVRFEYKRVTCEFFSASTSEVCRRLFIATTQFNMNQRTRNQSLPRMGGNPMNDDDVHRRHRGDIPHRFVQQPTPSDEVPKSVDDRIKAILQNRSAILESYLKAVYTDLVSQRNIKIGAASQGAPIGKWRSKIEESLTKQIGKLNISIVEQAKKDVDIPVVRADRHDEGERKRFALAPPTPAPARNNRPPPGPPASLQFGVSSIDSQISDLFQLLKNLPPMDKYGPMSGNCDRETTQMENFLKQLLGFQNIPGEYIVQGVQSFRLNKSIENLPQNTIIQFPNQNPNNGKSFVMDVNEIEQWQQSYRVYADHKQPGMTQEFLKRALQGRSTSGPQAFLMKFVVRVSTCPILMEFDGQVISRKLNESWPHNIKLVSVTGIDFAGRIHDIDDIRTYITNWDDVYEMDHQRNEPLVYNGRDFRRRLDGPRAQLKQDLLLHDLKQMARFRLRVCDHEKVEIVVETGIGLGAFAGKHIGIDDTVRVFSAMAIRQVLEEDAHIYRHIKAVIFALPIFESDTRNGQRNDTFHAFERVFRKDEYRGRIPVLIIDQDMHRLTVAIARQGLRVSELNPADSHGVFGEYWQNRGPAVEEKLALTTLGLLVQHHLINPSVCESRNYQIV